LDTLVLVVLADVLLATIAILKGRRLLGVAGIFLPPTSLYGAVRLAHPGSPWARRRYALGGAKLTRAQRRWERADAQTGRVRSTSSE
jgi:hypothetical protein